MKPYNGVYQPDNPAPYKLSRTKVELFTNCPRCFYLDRVLKIARPSTPPFNINSAVDSLLKAEFDVHRANGHQHPIQEQYGIDAEPAPHEELDKWRENFHGVQYIHEPSNLLLFGAIDDLWINSKGEYIVVDYKATAKNEPVTELGDAPWHDQYRRQIEFYQWLLRRNGYKVSDTGYWVYCTGNPNAGAFDKKVEFEVHLISYEGSGSWVEPTVMKLKQCLDSGVVPPPTEGCEYCAYIALAAEQL
ncbi:MAG: PD-(D/E)XK nuclease family protein [Candidatus Saccharibacteria bacterium]